MALSKEELMGAIKEMSVLELSELYDKIHQLCEINAIVQ